MRKLLIGTNNPSKLQVFADYLSGLDVQLLSPADLGLSSIPSETARNASGNAIEKAKAWYRLSGLHVITEDSGLVFLDLPAEHPDQPGVHVRRAAGHVMDDEEMLQWYAAIVRRHGGQLRAAWEDAWCVLQDETHYAVHSDKPQRLALHARLMVDRPCDTRVPGWPLDSLTYFPAIKKYKAEMTLEEMRIATDAIGPAEQQDRQELMTWLRTEVNSI